MAVFWVDGFGHYGTDETKMTDGAYAQVSGGSGVSGEIVELSTSHPRTGTTGIRVCGGRATAPILRYVYPASGKTAVGACFTYYTTQLPSTNDIVSWSFRDANNANNVTISVTSTGALRAYRGSVGGTILGTTTGPVITADAHHHIETYVVFSDTVGVVKIRVNNVEVLALTGQDTVATSLAESSQFVFTAATASLSIAQAIANGYEYFIDDFYMYDTSGSHGNAYPLGDLQAILLTATADTAEADFTKSSGSDGYALIDETSPDDTDYIAAAAATDRSDFAMTDLASTINYVETLFSHVRALKSDAGPAQLQQSFMQGTDRSAGTDRAITTAGTYWFDNHPTDPTTTVKWTRAGVNSAKLRYDRTT